LFIEQTDNEEAIPEQLPAGIFI
ncbi:ati2 chaperone, partial [Vibrio alginolyticus]|nr:ati2 chaperone [Vibrio alginolyticus]MDW2199624.1 ati2 chaperone [Vibrio sp. 2084]